MCPHDGEQSSSSIGERIEAVEREKILGDGGVDDVYDLVATGDFQLV